MKFPSLLLSGLEQMKLGHDPRLHGMQGTMVSDWRPQKRDGYRDHH